MRVLSATSTVCLTLCLSAIHASDAYSNPHAMTWKSQELTPWPHPASVSNGSFSLIADGGVLIHYSGSSSLLQRAVARYNGIINNQSAAATVKLPAGTTKASVSLTIDVQDSSENLGQDTDESYNLTIPTNGRAAASAQTVFGAIHALESFSQLFEMSDSLQTRGLPWQIYDKPRFAHRGVLIDSSRHYLPLSTIRGQIDAMSYAKLNLLHFHLVDFQSFPFASAAAPNLVKGAWSRSQTYSPADLEGLVQYAKDRGVRIMVEIDTPGHSASWGDGYPDVVTDCPDAISMYGGEGVVALDPSNNDTFAIVEKLLGELNNIFPDTTFHLGGDEVRFQCWNSSDKVKEFMRSQHFVTPTGDLDFPALEAYYDGKLLDIAARVLPGRTLMMYQEVFDNGIKLPDKIVFGVWKSRPNSPKGTNNLPIPQEVAKIAKAGHQVVLANGNDGEWYLNDGFGNGNQVSSWVSVYSLDPLNGTSGMLTPAQEKLVIGGEVSLWGEEIDQNNLMAKAWPRSAAFSEKMWSPQMLTTGSDATTLAGPRLTRMHCKLQARGIQSSPISPGSCY